MGAQSTPPSVMKSKSLRPVMPVSHFPHVMNADVPGPTARTAEGVREPADLEMALEDEDAPHPQLGHDGGKGERAHAGADDDGVVGMLAGCLFFGNAALCHENLPCTINVDTGNIIRDRCCVCQHARVKYF